MIEPQWQVIRTSVLDPRVAVKQINKIKKHGLVLKNQKTSKQSLDMTFNTMIDGALEMF